MKMARKFQKLMQNMHGHQFGVHQLSSPTGVSMAQSTCSAISTFRFSLQHHCNLLQLMQSVFKHNFIPSLFAVAAGVMAVHYELLVNVYDACPLPMLVGDSETGKSSAARCVLSLCGQSDSGHLMNTKSTSDSICIERCCKSTLPFVLDDPKSLEVVSELLIDLCNGRLMGNLKVGLRKPRSIPLICCNFSDTKHHRYSSRALVLPFSPPSIGPKCEEDSEAFAQLAATQKEASSAVGWVISLGKVFLEDGKREVSSRLVPSVRDALPGVDPRLCTGYACLLFFAEKLVEEAQMDYLKEEMGDFLQEIHPSLKESPASASTAEKGSLQHHLVVVALKGVTDWAKDLFDSEKSYEVLRTVRIGITHQGKPAVAVCLDDFHHLTTDSKSIQSAVKGGNLGAHNVAKDFVPPTSTNPVIKRGVNSKSRKCTVIWIDCLPLALKTELERVLSNQVIPSSEMICQTSTPLPSPTAKSPVGINQSAEHFSSDDEVHEISPSPSADAVVRPDAVMETNANVTFEVATTPSATPTPAPTSIPIPTKNRKKRGCDNITGSIPKRRTRQNTRPPEWSRDLNSNNPLEK